MTGWIITFIFRRSIHESYGIMLSKPYYVYKFFILCELKGGSFTETFDILGKGFFRLEELPPLSLERVLPEQIQRMYAYYKHPGEDVYLD